MHKLNNRFNYLRRMEALAAVVLPIVFILDWRRPATDVHWPLGLGALVSVSYLLVQRRLVLAAEAQRLVGLGAIAELFLQAVQRIQGIESGAVWWRGAWLRGPDTGCGLERTIGMAARDFSVRRAGTH